MYGCVINPEPERCCRPYSVTADDAVTLLGQDGIFRHSGSDPNTICTFLPVDSRDLFKGVVATAQSIVDFTPDPFHDGAWVRCCCLQSWQVWGCIFFGPEFPLLQGPPGMWLWLHRLWQTARCWLGMVCKRL